MAHSREELYIPTRFGNTHVIASGPKVAALLVLFIIFGESDDNKSFYLQES